MNGRERLLAALKRILKERDWRYLDLAAALGLSEPTVKRMLSNGRIGLDRLEQICDALDIDFFELARSARGGRETRRHLSLAQETALAAEPRLMTEEDLVALRGVGLSDDEVWDVAEIAAMYNFTNRMALALGQQPNPEYHRLDRAP